MSGDISVARWRADMRFPLGVCVFVSFAVITIPLLAQSPNGNINGLVSDPSSAAVVGAEVVAVNDVTRVQYTAKTNSEGIYVLANLPPGPYRVQVSKIGFKTLIKPDIVINVQDSLSINFTLLVGAFHEVVTVQGGAPLVNTENATVSTVVDRQFAENLPMNGRSFQTLIELTPGVVLTTSTNNDAGQFSVNGQRASSNYWMVDGVSANIGASTVFPPGNGAAGALGSFSVLGGTNSLVSIDALQEFRIQTSTFAPEFGRTPGGQVSIVTRSGTNQFHGTAFDYLRNDLLDANDWFADNVRLKKPEERQNDFGGTWGGPLRRDRTFFFFSYEGLRLRLPQTLVTTVPDVAARRQATAMLKPILNAYPMANGADDLSTGIADFNATYSNAASLDAYSLRIDHRLTGNVSLFGRYDYSPSQLLQRGAGGTAASVLSLSRIKTETATIGLSWPISATKADDLRINYSRTNGDGSSYLDGFGGAQPMSSLPLPSPFTSGNANFFPQISSLMNGELSAGKQAQNLQRQINIVNNLIVQTGSHGLKFGFDFRRLSPGYAPALYSQFVDFPNVQSAVAGSVDFSEVQSFRNATLLFHNLGAYAQDTWRIFSRLTATYGLRWDVDFAPSSSNGPNIAAVENYGNLSALTLAPAGTRPFRTTYGNLAPRVGLAYEILQKSNWQTVLRGGFGVFFDLATQEVGNSISSAYPFGAATSTGPGVFPLSPASATPPSITPPTSGSGGLYALDPHLQLPYTLEWNFSVEQALGTQQTVSASYIGSNGRRLIQTAFVFSPNPNLAYASLVGNTAASDYHALQIQLRRRLARGLQVLASYTWSHSIDDASAGSYGNPSNTLVPTLDPKVNRGNSDFDIRNSLSGAVTYDFPPIGAGKLTKVLISGWSVNGIVQVHSAPPVDVFDGNLFSLFGGYSNVRPDVVVGQPFYLYGRYPGGRALNSAAFTAPPTDAAGNPIREGDLGRNSLRGFPFTQWDFATHRDFPLVKTLKLQFRVELFNLLNHPNFGPPAAYWGVGGFGVTHQMLGQSLGRANVGGGGLSPLYQIGGPRSIQFALKLLF
jgi:hypothetical protein